MEANSTVIQTRMSEIITAGHRDVQSSTQGPFILTNSETKNLHLYLNLHHLLVSFKKLGLPTFQGGAETHLRCDKKDKAGARFSKLHKKILGKSYEKLTKKLRKT